MRIFSGVQPTGNLHLGNYLGAIRQFVDLQKKPAQERIFCVVDYHAITVKQDPLALAHATRKVVACFLAAGLEAGNNILFNQSMVRAHCELAWIFNCVARIGWLNRMTQFKEKAGANREKASVGLYIYPNLMAADILAYHGDHVPVGEDQKQHLELVRDIAQKFNTDFAVPGFFPQAEALILPEAARIMSLRDGTQKMSKSDPSDFSRINLDDTQDLIVQKIRKAKTDSGLLPARLVDLKRRPEADNLLGMTATLSGEEKKEIVKKFAGLQFSELKKELTDLIIEKIVPIGVEMRKLEQNPEYIDAILRDGAEKACQIADPILAKTRSIIGFVGANKAGRL